ncbi:MAG: hypothetical protein V4450_14040 [Bacteroidota bacterium]
MKKYLLISSLLLTSLAHAQLDKGSKLVGLQTNLIVGDIYNTSLALSLSPNRKNYGFNLVPTFGYVLQRNWLIGGQFTVGWEKEKYPNAGLGYTQTYTYTDLGFAPFTRLYLDLTRNKKWKLYGLAAVDIANSWVRSVSNNQDSPYTNYHSTTGYIGIGAAYFGRRVSLDLNVAKTGLRLGIYRVFGPSKK